jgi:hypothetical protein
MKTSQLLKIATLSLAVLVNPALIAEVQFTSPGFAPSKMDGRGRLIESWGTLDLQIASAGASDSIEVKSIRLDDLIPAAQANSHHGSVRVSRTAYRAPVWPSGLDVLTVRLEETSGRAQSVPISLVLPEGARLGARMASVGGRAVVSLPADARANQAKRDWGCFDDSTALRGWAKPAIACDPAFRNIRAGMGGAPIHYRFKIEPKAARTVVLGFCESHWETSGQRPMLCRVEGAPAQSLDCNAKWGQHQPGALQFMAKDENGDGELEVTVLPAAGAPDQNPILNVLWIFPADVRRDLAQIVAGRHNDQAQHYVDVGGPSDQSLFAGGELEFAVQLPAQGTKELQFLVATGGGSVPLPESTAWTPAKLRQAAAQVWREWQDAR